MAESLSKINCPACGKEMKEIAIPDAGFFVDICVDGCGGIFFDNREFEHFDEQHENMQKITNALEGKTFIKTDESLTRVCPVCGSNMIKNFSSIKRDIQIDDCYSCGGKFLDYQELDKIRAEYSTSAERANDAIKSLGLNIQKAPKQSLGFKAYKTIIDKLIFR